MHTYIYIYICIYIFTLILLSKFTLLRNYIKWEFLLYFVLDLSRIMLKNGQAYFKNLAVFNPLSGGY